MSSWFNFPVQPADARWSAHAFIYHGGQGHLAAAQADSADGFFIWWESQEIVDQSPPVGGAWGAGELGSWGAGDHVEVSGWYVKSS